MALKDRIDVRTGHKLRRMTLDEVRAADAIFDAMRTERELASRLEAAEDTAPEVSVAEVRAKAGPKKLASPFESL